MWKQTHPQMKQRQVKFTEEPLPLQWQVNVTGRSEEVHHILFVKVHKAASSTLSSLFLRFAFSRQLNVLFPRAGRNILSERWRWPLARLSRHPPSPPFLFDIVCNHLVYDRRAERFLPEDVVRIVVLREPLSQVYSAFNYYRKVYREEYLKHPSSFRDFLSRQDHYENRGPYRSFTNNRMSLDLGLPLKQLKNSSHVKHFVKEVDDLFDLVLIAERFDESMILLKRRLKWTMKDVLYISINKGAKSQQRPPKLDQAIKKKFRKFDQFDNGLYDYFSQKFDKLVREEGQGFKDEVQAYKDILQQFCKLNKSVLKSHIFRRSHHHIIHVLPVNRSRRVQGNGEEATPHTGRGSLSASSLTVPLFTSTIKMSSCTTVFSRFPPTTYNWPSWTAIPNKARLKPVTQRTTLNLRQYEVVMMVPEGSISSTSPLITTTCDRATGKASCEDTFPS
ncbi:hypothetical protein ACOMHN_004000 [Nucella lapillus]